MKTLQSLDFGSRNFSLVITVSLHSNIVSLHASFTTVKVTGFSLQTVAVWVMFRNSSVPLQSRF